MKRGLLYFLLVPPAVLLCGGSLTLAGFLLSYFPPVVTWVGVGLLLVVLLWWFFARRSAVVPGSETALMGRQTSKDGLL